MAETLEPPEPGLELLARFTVELSAPAWDLGATSALGTRRIVPITGGRIEGPRLAGEILDNGADWQIVTASTTIIDTRYLASACRVPATPAGRMEPALPRNRADASVRQRLQLVAGDAHRHRRQALTATSAAGERPSSADSRRSSNATSPGAAALGPGHQRNRRSARRGSSPAQLALCKGGLMAGVADRRAGFHSVTPPDPAIEERRAGPGDALG